MFRFRGIAAGLFALIAPSAIAWAQSAPARPSANAANDQVCLGFSFGKWKPALNWRAAGHGDFPDSNRLQHAPLGRDWAMGAGDPDSSLMLFPAWWPVGVLVALPNRAPAPGDTVSGEAIALRANADSTSPRTKVRAWRVACGSGR